MQIRIRYTKPDIRAGASSRVAAGILVSRITGLLRQSIFAHYLGISPAAGVFTAAFRIPNVLSNLFGEGVLSAAFVTVYSRLRAQEEYEEAEHVAAAVFGVLSLVCAALVLLGVLAAPLLVEIIAPGFKAENRALTITLVRILFPGAGVLVLSAWCLGVLNSHRRFLLSYTAPVAMNAAMITALLLFGRRSPSAAVTYLACGSVIGSILQFLVQLPRVLQLLPHFRPVFDTASEQVRTVIRNFGPVFVSRGVVQLSATIDQIIATLLGAAAVSTLGFAQVIALLPVSLFSMSIAAAELPAMSSVLGSDEERQAHLRLRLTTGLRRIAFFIVPSAAAFLLLGDVIAGLLYRTGKFSYADSVWVWAVLAGSAIGLLATSLGRLYSSAFYALLDTRTPLRFAIVRVTITGLLGYVAAKPLPLWLGIDPKWGVAGLTASAGIAGWVEFALLRRALTQTIGPSSIPISFVSRLWATALASGLLAYALKTLMGTRHPHLLGVTILPLYGILYFAGTAALGVEESRRMVAAVKRRL